VLDDLAMVTVQVGIEQVQIRSSMTLNKLIDDFGIKIVLNLSLCFSLGRRVAAYLVGGHEIPHILLHHLPFYRQTLDVRRSRFSRKDIFECIAFAQVNLD
jgi:hypothetical protein